MEYSFDDALAGSTVTCTYPNIQSASKATEQPLEACPRLFFPGCSFLNYGMPLVQAVRETLAEAGAIDGMSLVCCGKILSYEPNGEEVRARFEDQLRERLVALGVQTIIAACPNCVKALREACAKDECTSGIQVVPLPVVLAELGYRIDPEAAAQIASPEVSAYAAAQGKAEQGQVVVPVFAPHDSCPDRETGEFAAAVRTLLEQVEVRELAHNRKKSLCCGSLVRAAGKMDAAVKCSLRRGEEALEAGANALVAPCVSCTSLLSLNQQYVPTFHYLELLYAWRIDWLHADPYMRLRFLLEQVATKEERAESRRSFTALSSDQEG